MSPVTDEGLEQIRARWRSAVAGVLAKSRPGADAGVEPERALETPSYEGFAVRALYTALDALPEAPLPGDWPYRRGGDRDRDVLAGWKVAEEFPAPGFSGSAADGNAAVLDALVNGVSALVDADMNQASTRLQALQTQQQLGIQSLSIANQSSQLILKLFQ